MTKSAAAMTASSPLNGAAPSPRTPVNDAIPHDAATDQSILGDLKDELLGDVAQLLGLPNWKRCLISLVTYVAGVVGLLYVGTTVIEALLISSLLGSAPLFIGVIIAALSACLIAYYGHKAVLRVAGAIATGEADQRAEEAYAAMKGIFARLNPFAKKVEAQAPKAA